MIEPFVRLMVACEDARERKGSAGKIDILGVINQTFTPADAFPARLTFSVYLCLTDGHGRGYGRIVIVEEDTEHRVYVGTLRLYDFGNDPVSLLASTIRIPMCTLPRPGMYRIEFVYNDRTIGNCPLLVKETP